MFSYRQLSRFPFSDGKLLVVDKINFSHLVVDNLSHRLCFLVIDNIWLSITNSCRLLMSSLWRPLVRTNINLECKRIKTESARRWSNKWTKTLYQDYLQCIANFCKAILIIFSEQFISSNTKRRKRMLNFV